MALIAPMQQLIADVAQAGLVVVTFFLVSAQLMRQVRWFGWDGEPRERDE